MRTGQSAQELLMFDPRLYSGLEKYVWISDSAKAHGRAQGIFANMLKMGIYIKGFATDKETLVGLTMFNKEIYDITALDQEKTIVFDDFYLWWSYDKIELPEKVHSMRILNPDMSRENIIIWGSGKTGRHVYRMLSANGIKVEFFVDSNRDLAGMYQYGLPVYTPEYLDRNASNPIIIEAMEKWAELDECIRGKYEKRFFFSYVEADGKKPVYNGCYITRMFNLMSWHVNFAYFIGKKMYVYGDGEVEREMVKYLRLLDISFEGFLTDEPNVVKDKEAYGNYDVKPVEDILYEKEYFVWVYDKKRAERLEELGLKSHIDYIYYDGADNLSVRKKHILDTNLGYNLLADDCKYPGITIYGDDKESDYKIAVLGGSTTDGRAFSYKSWPELMHEELCDNGLRDITVYNGGVSGYTSGQELLKLIRDMIPLNPDMVIVYDGANDERLGTLYPITSGYLMKVFEFVSEHLVDIEDDGFLAGKDVLLCRGIKSEEDRFVSWMSNIRTMYAVSSERNIGFYSFYQPMLIGKKEKTRTEKNMLLSDENRAIVRLMEGSFQERIRQMTKLPGYMYDLSHIFDYEQDIYVDMVHVWEKGNRIIAREIAKIILPELSCK